MVSLLAFANITEEGVNFRSPFDGKQMLLTPEKSIQLQNAIGSDIMMQLDDVVGTSPFALPCGPLPLQAMQLCVTTIT